MPAIVLDSVLLVGYLEKMRKIKSLYMRNYDGDGLVRDEVVEGSEWVLAGEGKATVKYDGTCCLVRDGKLYRRHDRKLTKAAFRRKKAGEKGPWPIEDFKPAPPEWEACEPEPDQATTHWPGWIPVGDGPEDKWYREAWSVEGAHLSDGTHELVGPKINGNPHHCSRHRFWRHGIERCRKFRLSFEGIGQYLRDNGEEGIVWHHPDGRMVKIKRRDFGLPWPISPDPAETPTGPDR
jgi:hypothetical protein